MENGNKRKYELLGEPHGTANARLRKMILFMLIQELGKDTCWRCGRKITIDTLSIEHKIDWQGAENPKECFFDLENITFSHLKCNIEAADKTNLRKNCPYGENNGQAKHSNKVIENIKKDLDSGISVPDAAKKYNIRKRHLYKIKSGEIWKKTE